YDTAFVSPPSVHGAARKPGGMRSAQRRTNRAPLGFVARLQSGSIGAVGAADSVPSSHARTEDEPSEHCFESRRADTFARGAVAGTMWESCGNDAELKREGIGNEGETVQERSGKDAFPVRKLGGYQESTLPKSIDARLSSP